MLDAFLVLFRIHPRAYFCTVVAGRLVFNTASESQKWMRRGPRSFIFASAQEPITDVLFYTPCIVCCCCCILHINRSGLNHTQ